MHSRLRIAQSFTAGMMRAKIAQSFTAGMMRAKIAQLFTYSPAVYGRGESPIPLLCPSAQISKGSLMTPLPFRMYYLFIVLYQ